MRNINYLLNGFYAFHLKKKNQTLVRASFYKDNKL